MKQLLKKFSASILIMAFIIQPIMNVVLNCKVYGRNLNEWYCVESKLKDVYVYKGGYPNTYSNTDMYRCEKHRNAYCKVHATYRFTRRYNYALDHREATLRMNNDVAFARKNGWSVKYLGLSNYIESVQFTKSTTSGFQRTGIKPNNLIFMATSIACTSSYEEPFDRYTIYQKSWYRKQNNPNTPSEPSKPDTPNQPNQPSEPSNPDTPAKPVEPTYPDTSWETVKITDDQKRLYIRKLYFNVLGREPKLKEIEDNMKYSLVGIARKIIFSDESQNKNKINSLKNEEYMKKLYNWILLIDDEKINSDSLKSNVSQLNNSKKTRYTIINTLVTSAEFSKKFSDHEKKYYDTSTVRIKIDNKELCNAIYKGLCNYTAYTKQDKFGVIKTSDTELLMNKASLEIIKTLDISGTKVTSLKGISNFPNLEKLVAQDCQIEDFTELDKLEKLHHLNLSGNKKIGEGNFGFKLAKRLRTLKLDNTGINVNNNSFDFKKDTEYADTLEILSLANNNITDVVSVKGLKKLKDLNIDGNKIGNHTIAKTLPLEKFSAKGNKISQTGETSEVELPEIFADIKDKNSKLYTEEEFELTNCKIENGKLIPNVGQVATVKVKGGQADGTVFEYTDRRTTITFKDKVLANRLSKQLHLGSNPIELSNGEYQLAMSEERINRISNLNLSSTEEDQENITSVKGLEVFQNLNNLNLNNNKVGDIQEITDKLKNLKSLSLKNNELTNIDSIGKLTNLMNLDLSCNYIEDVSPLKNLTNLQTLILNNNEIGNNLSPLNELKNLTILDISNNVTTDISGLNNLKLSEFYCSENRIKDLTPLNKENLTKLEMKDNAIWIYYNETDDSIEMPNFFQYDIEKNGGTDNLKYNKEYFTIENNKIIPKASNDGLKVEDDIRISSGDFAGSVIHCINNKRIINSDEVTIHRFKKSDGSVNAELWADVDFVIPNYSHNNNDWEEINETGNGYAYRKNYTYNVENQRIKTTNMYQAPFENLVLNINNATNQNIPDLKLSYSTADDTNKDVVVTISSSENLCIDPNNNARNWKLSADKKSMSCTISENVKFDVDVMLEKEYQSVGNYNDIHKEKVIVDVVNIDKEVATTRSDGITYLFTYYDEEENSGIVTIEADEPFEVVETSGKVISSNSRYVTLRPMYHVNIYYRHDTKEMVKIKDKLSNTRLVEVDLKGVDEEIIGLNSNTGSAMMTNQDDTLKISAKEGIIINAVEEVNEKLRNLAASLDNSSEFKMQYSINLSEGMSGAVAVNDEKENTEFELYNADYIDKTIPQVEEKTEEINENGTRLVTLKINEPVQYTNSIAGWDISKDGKTLTKTYTADTKETVKITDLAGNEGSYEVEVEDVQAIKFETEVTQIDGTDKYLVVIKADREIKEVEGWELLEDKKSIGKIVSSGKVTVTISDYEGNSSKVMLEIFDDEVEEENNEDNNGENKENQENNKEDNTQSPNAIPQTGKNAIIGVVLIIAVSVVAIVTLKKYKKM